MIITINIRQWEYLQVIFYLGVRTRLTPLKSMGTNYSLLLIKSFVNIASRTDDVGCTFERDRVTKRTVTGRSSTWTNVILPLPFISISLAGLYEVMHS